MVKNKHDSSSSSEENDISAPNIDVIQPVSVVLADDVSYRTYQLYDRSQTYDGEIAARTARLSVLQNVWKLS